MAKSIFRFALPPSVQPDAIVSAPPQLSIFLEKNLGQPVDVTVSHSYDAMLRNLKSGALDAAWAPPMLCARAEPEGMRVVVQTVRGGHASYASAFIMRAGGAQPMKKWRGIRAAFVEPLSVAGHLLPMAYVRDQGLHPEVIFAPERQFLGSYREALIAVRERRADVCCVHALEGDAESPFRAIKIHLPGAEGDFDVVATTEEVPSDGVVVRRASGSAARRLERAFLSKGENPFRALFRADGFVPTLAGAYRALYRVAPRA